VPAGTPPDVPDLGGRKVPAAGELADERVERALVIGRTTTRTNGAGATASMVISLIPPLRAGSAPA